MDLAALKRSFAVIILVVLLLSIPTNAYAGAWGAIDFAPVGLSSIKAGFGVLGMPFSQRLFANAMEDGLDLYFGETKDVSFSELLPAHISAQIRQELSYRRAEAEVLRRAKASVTGSASASFKNVEIKSQNDAYYSLHGFHYGVT